MKASVAMCLYNGEKFIIEQLESLKHQSVQPYRVLISDDCSTDKGPELVQNYIKDNSLENSWMLRRNTANKGYAKNFLDTALSVDGDVVFFCDQDDIWDYKKIETMMSVMENHNEIMLLCSNLEPFYYEEDTVHWDPKVLASMTNDGSLEYCTVSATNIHLRRSGCTMCIRKLFLNEIIPYWTERWAHDDYVWKFAVMNNSCAIKQYCSMKRRMHSNNTTVIRKRTREWRIKQILEFENQYRSLLEYVKVNEPSNEKIKIINKNIKALQLRRELIEKKKLWLWPILYFKYADCYPRKKGLFLDAFLTIRKSYNNAN